MPQPEASKLRQNIRFDVRSIEQDGMGNERNGWEPFVTRKCSLLPTKRSYGNEEVIANRLTGTGVWDLIVYADAFTKTITESYRAVQILNDGSDGKEFNIRFVGDLYGNGRWLFMQLQEGVASG